MYKKHKWLSGLREVCTFNQLRQICDLTSLLNSLNMCQNANLAQCNLIGMSFEITYVSYTKRWQ
jgi:flagellar hook assembly protein FlgD